MLPRQAFWFIIDLSPYDLFRDIFLVIRDLQYETIPDQAFLNIPEHDLVIIDIFHRFHLISIHSHHHQ